MDSDDLVYSMHVMRFFFITFDRELLESYQGWEF